MKDIIQSIREGDDRQVNTLYRSYRSEFHDWALKNFTASAEQVADAFQEAVVIFYLNVKKGKITTLDSTVKTYLFAVGRNVLSNKIRKENKTIYVDPDTGGVDSLAAERMTDPFEINDRQRMIAGALRKLGDKCHRLLKLFYYEGNSMEAIAIKMAFKNENVAKSQKLRCLRSLKEIIKTQ